MVSLLSMINSYLSYINLNVKIKNRIYTAMASVGDFYLLYVSYRFFVNGYWGRGLLFILAFLVIAYFAYLNILYYFTEDKKSQFDVSPWIEKTFHLEAKDPLTDAPKPNNAQAGFVQTNGIFQDTDFLPAEITFSETQKSNLARVVEDLLAVDYLQLDYGGLGERQLFTQAKNGDKPLAMGAPLALPYFELAQDNQGQLKIWGGLNQMQRRDLGTVETVGLMPASEAMERYHLYLATVLLTGGPYRVAGRTSSVEKEAPFALESRVAYRQRGVHGVVKEAETQVAAEFKSEESRVEKVLQRADRELRRRR
ncbi:DUF6681 family protein [Ligilactobacillus equi]|nr:hypothetical protein [Ligilactobacillus sp.]